MSDSNGFEHVGVAVVSDDKLRALSDSFLFEDRRETVSSVSQTDQNIPIAPPVPSVMQSRKCKARQMRPSSRSSDVAHKCTCKGNASHKCKCEPQNAPRKCKRGARDAPHECKCGPGNVSHKCKHGTRDGSRDGSHQCTCGSRDASLSLSRPSSSPFGNCSGGGANRICQGLNGTPVVTLIREESAEDECMWLETMRLSFYAIIWFGIGFVLLSLSDKSMSNNVQSRSLPGLGPPPTISPQIINIAQSVEGIPASERNGCMDNLLYTQLGNHVRETGNRLASRISELENRFVRHIRRFHAPQKCKAAADDTSRQPNRAYPIPTLSSKRPARHEAAKHSPPHIHEHLEDHRVRCLLDDNPTRTGVNLNCDDGSDDIVVEDE